MFTYVYGLHGAFIVQNVCSTAQSLAELEITDILYFIQLSGYLYNSKYLLFQDWDLCLGQV